VGGTGLGLSIARRLAEVQGGRLTYEPSEEATSRFVLSLPAATVPSIEGSARSL
jgi:signal transduction histidine kinase